ncbi:2-hydroxychromene-2-carboxylate isomerase [Candidatus Pelagibacter sp.]|nr:2-hydroxychromene-2-carboxylate isomerase [Candidatus Pelagibacter sp.]
MTKSIDFYFDFISPYTYIGHNRIKNEGNGINFIYKPILLGGLHKLWNITPQAFIEPKKQFMIMDCEMVSKKFKIEFKFNSNFPINTINLMRGCLVLNNEQLKKYINLIFDAYWKNNENISDERILTKVLAEIEMDISEFKKKTEEIEVKEKLKKLTNEAFKMNIFGAPTYVVNNKNFWGQDRFEYALEELNSTS